MSWLQILLFGFAVLAATAARPVEAQTKISAETRHLLILYNICILSGGKKDSLEELGGQMGFRLLSSNDASRFLGGRSGHAYRTDMSFRTYVIAADPKVWCSVHAFEADAQELESAFIDFSKNVFRNPDMPSRAVIKEPSPDVNRIYSYVENPILKDKRIRLSLSLRQNSSTEPQAVLEFGVVGASVPAVDTSNR